MPGRALRRVAIWIDRNTAVLTTYEGNADPGAVLDEGASRRYPAALWSKHCVDAAGYHTPELYYDAVIAHLAEDDRVLILGPGPAKEELRERIRQHRGLKGRVVALYGASKLAEVELIAPTRDAAGPTMVNGDEVDRPIALWSLGLPETQEA